MIFSIPTFEYVIFVVAGLLPYAVARSPVFDTPGAYKGFLWISDSDPLLPSTQNPYKTWLFPKGTLKQAYVKC